jgi:hypothetical protein
VSRWYTERPNATHCRPAHAAAEFDGPVGDTPHSAVELQLDLPDGLGACESGSDASGGGDDDWLLARPSPRASAPCSPRPARGEVRGGRAAGGHAAARVRAGHSLATPGAALTAAAALAGCPQARRPKPLTLVPLVALIFYEVSGGPFGIEVGGGWHGW